MLKSWSKFRRWWYKIRNPISFIDQILENPPLNSDFYDRAHWIKSIVDWIRRESPSATRVKYILNLLERNPEWKKHFTQILTQTIDDLRFQDALCDLGLPVELSFFGEIFKRIGNAILPREPVDSKLSSLLHWIFANEEDAEWLENLDEKTIENLFNLLSSAKVTYFERDRKDALLVLSAIIRSIGFSNDFRQISAADEDDLQSNIFFKLGKLVEVEASRDELIGDTPEIKVAISQAVLQIDKIYHNLEETGVSIEMVYQLERLKGYLSRIESLLRFSIPEEKTPQNILKFLSLMIRKNVETRSLRKFIAQNISLLSKRIVKTNSEVGEHYITRDIGETTELLKTAVGGGIITSATVYLKIFISVFPGSPFIIGLLHSTNYSVSFLIIQLKGLTLASKQPANTAPALAQKLQYIENEGQESKLTESKLIDEIIHLVRSQMTSIFGNILGVVPTVLLVSFLYQFLTTDYMISPERAEYILSHHDLLGGTWIYAAFTGVLLFAASLIGGAADNWFKFRKLRRTIARNETLTTLFGRVAARKISEFLSHNFSGIASSIGLGILLGLLPEILRFIGIPLEVRHVTLSFGTVAVALPLLSSNQILSWTMLRILFSLIGIGILNVSISFTLALLVALRSQDLRGAKRRMIFGELFKRFCHKPLNFFWPS